MRNRPNCSRIYGVSRVARVVPVVALVSVVTGVSVWAQYRVDTRVGPVYGGGASSSVRYGYVNPGGSSTSMPLPSEVRNAYVRSGALPSDIRYGRSSVGGLAPQGAMSYIPQGGGVVIRDQAPIPVYTSPSGGPRPMTFSTSAALTASSIRYGNVATSPAAPAWTKPMSAAAPSSAATPGAVTPAATNAIVAPRTTFGSIHYSSPPATAPAK